MLRQSQNKTFRPRVVQDYQVWLPARDRVWGICPCGIHICLVPWREHRTTALGGTGDWLTPGRHRMKLEGSCIALANSTPHMTWIHHWCIWLREILGLGGYLLWSNSLHKIYLIWLHSKKSISIHIIIWASVGWSFVHSCPS